MKPIFAFATVFGPQGDMATIVVDGGHYRLDRLLPSLPTGGLRPLMNDWAGLLASVRPLVAGLSPASDAYVADPRLAAPLRYPNKVVCVGAVYSDHLVQFDLPPERWPRMPIFLRPPTTSIVGPGCTVHIPPATKEFDWEIELAVIIGQRLVDGDEDAARSAIAGYSVGIDFTCRDLLDRGSAVGVDLIRAKAQDEMGPIGPTIVPAEFVGDPQQLKLQLSVNGVRRQDSTTANMLFSVYEQVATISRYITLEPGDVVFTGSPAGSAEGEDQFLKPGDKISAEIENVGCLELELLPPRTTAIAPELQA